MWEEVVVPEGVTVIDQRGKEGEGPRISGVVHDLGKGEALAGAEVSLRPGSQKVEGELPVATSDKERRYVLENVPGGGFHVVASCEGYATKRSLTFESLQGTDMRSEEFHLSKATTLSGVVSDSLVRRVRRNWIRGIPP